MLDKLSAVLNLSAEGDWSSIMGDVPSAEGLATLAPMAQQRPAARKFAGGIAITVPLTTGGWHFWLLSAVIGVSELPGAMARLQDLSKGIAGLNVARTPATIPASSLDGTAALIAKVAARTESAKTIKPKALAPLLLDSLIEQGLMESGAVVKWTGRRRPKVWLSDERLYSKTDEILAICRAMQDTTPQQRLIAADDADEDTVEMAVLTRSLNNKAAAVVLPPQGKRGYGIICFGNANLDIRPLAAAVDLLHLKFPVARTQPKPMRIVRRLATAAALAGGVYFLAQPAPTILTAVGTTVAADVTVVTLPSDAYLTRMHVRVGDTVAAGDVLGEFSSRTLEDAIAEERLNASVEQLTAQAAMAENNYGTFQLANQRLEIAQTRIDQLVARKAALNVVAPTDGHVIFAMSDTVSGLFAQTGREVVQLQTSPDMQVRLELSRMDARLIKPGMDGTAYFRGLSQKSFDVAIAAQPAAVTDPETGETRIESKADVASADGLIVGMTGFLRLNGPDAPRYVSYSRYVAEFVREKSWTYLGLHL